MKQVFEAILERVRAWSAIRRNMKVVHAIINPPVVNYRKLSVEVHLRIEQYKQKPSPELHAEIWSLIQQLKVINKRIPRNYNPTKP